MHTPIFGKSLLFSVSLLLGIWQAGQAQQGLYPLKTLHDSIQFGIVPIPGGLSLLIDEPAWQKAAGFPEIRGVSIIESDLVVEYLEGKSKQSSYEFKMRVSSNDGPIVAPNGYEISETPVSTENGQSVRRYIWQDATEALFVPGRMYTLHIQRSLMGAVNCQDPRPAFKLSKQLPYYGGALVGLTSSGIGLYLLKRSDDEYEQYRQFWSDARSETEADVFYKNAKKYRKNGQILLYSGLALTGIDAVLYYVKWNKIKRKQQLYDKFCGSNTSYFEFKPGSNSNLAGFIPAGARLAWHF